MTSTIYPSSPSSNNDIFPANTADNLRREHFDELEMSSCQSGSHSGITNLFFFFFAQCNIIVNIMLTNLISIENFSQIEIVSFKHPQHVEMSF